MKHPSDIRPTLLIVDDIDTNLAFLETIIRKIPVTLIQALSGAEALEATRGVELVLAIIDVRMPGMNGYELAEKLNAERSGDKVPVIFLTANHPDEKELLKGYHSGAVDYVFKPVSSYIIESKIRVFLDLFNQKQTIRINADLIRKSADGLARVNAVIKGAKEKYRSYIDNAPDGVFVIDGTGKYIEVNEAAAKITGYPVNELLEMSIADMLPEESVKQGIEEFRNLLAIGKSSAEMMFRHKSGFLHWWSVDAVRLSETRFLGFAKDITDRKKAELDLQVSLEQLHQLTQYIQKVREDERVAISRELHDDLGQSLTAIKIDLGIIRQGSSESETILNINKLSALVSDTIRTVQRLTSQLRPQIIDDLGLVVAIEWHTGEFEQRTGIKISLDLDSQLTISKKASLIIFRIVQESLTNISRHSGADMVHIVLSQIGEQIYLRVSDNGIGISDDQMKSNKAFGLMSMKERAVSLGGRLEISRAKKSGTVVSLLLPQNQINTNEDPDL